MLFTVGGQNCIKWKRKCATVDLAVSGYFIKSRLTGAKISDNILINRPIYFWGFGGRKPYSSFWTFQAFQPDF